MTTPDTTARQRRYRLTLALLLLAIAGLSAAALLTRSDAWDTVLGFFTGVLSVALLAYAVVGGLRRRADSRRRDTVALDGLEPLRGSNDAGSQGDGDGKS